MNMSEPTSSISFCLKFINRFRSLAKKLLPNILLRWAYIVYIKFSRPGVQIVETKGLAVIKGVDQILLNRAHYPYVKDVIDSFDYYFDAVDFVDVGGG